MTKSIASGADRHPMVRGAFIARRASIAMVRARTSASGAARPRPAPAASTAPRAGMRSKGRKTKRAGAVDHPAGRLRLLAFLAEFLRIEKGDLLRGSQLYQP